jgi:hypothetical protein
MAFWPAAAWKKTVRTALPAAKQGGNKKVTVFFV